MDEARWNRLLVSLGMSDRGDTYQKLKSAYSEKHRAYHTESHIDDCLQKFDVNRDLFEHPVSVEVAIWFHDSIYRPFSKTNEEDSAKWAQEFLVSLNADCAEVSRVYRLIQVTKHSVEVRTNDESVLVDLDLSILGSSPAVYDKFEKAVRYEYKYVPGLIFRKKRAHLLSEFLRREYIYFNERFRDLYEIQARSNMKNAIEKLLR